MRVEVNHVKFPLTGTDKRVCKVFRGERTTVARALGPETRKRDVLVSHSRLGNVPREAWAGAAVVDGDRLVVTPRMADPFSIGSAISILTSPLIQGVARGLAAPLTAAGAFSALGYGINTLFQSLIPQLPSFANGNLESSPTYGFDGMRNTAAGGIPVPAFYGERRIAGNFINSFIENPVDFDGNGSITVSAGERDISVAYILMALGEGVFEEIAGETADFDFDTDAAVQALGDLIMINGNPVSALSNIKVYGRMGNDVQTHIPGFEYAHDLHIVDNQIEFGAPETYTTEGSDVDDVILQLSMKNGGYTVQANGKIDPVTERFKIEARPAGGSWTVLYSDYRIWVETRSTVRRSVRLDLPSLLAGPGQYEIRVTKLTPDSTPFSAVNPSNGESTRVSDTWLAQVDEVRYDTYTYPNTALLGVVVEASDQLNGEITSLQVHCRGRKVDGQYVLGTPADFWTDNPAYIINDLINNTRFGMRKFVSAVSTDPNNIDEAADFCDALETNPIDGSTEKRFRLDAVLDEGRPSVDWLADLALHMTAFVYWIGNVIKIVPDGATTPDFQINHANIVRDSFSIAYAPASSVLNKVDVQFFPEENNYAQELVTIEDNDAIQGGDAVVASQFALHGCIRRSQAVRTGRFRLNDARNNIRTASWRMGSQGLTLEPGRVVKLATDIAGWAVASGRILADAAGTSVTLDTAVNLPIVAGGTYTLNVHHDDETQESREITSHIDGLNPAGTALTIASAFSQTAEEYATTWDITLAGAATGNTTAKPFRVMDMRLLENFEVEVTAREYNVETYDVDGDPSEPPNYTSLPDPRRVPSPVQNLILSFAPSTDPKIRADYELAAIDSEAGFIDRVEVYIAESDETARERWQLDGVRRPGVYHTATPLSPNRTYYIKVIPVSRWGVRGNWAAATAASITIRAPVPLAPRGIEVNQQGNNGIFATADASFQWVENDQRGFQRTGFGLGEEPLGFGAESRSPWTKGFLVSIWSDGKLRRREEINSTRYRYTLDMNRDDHAGAPARAFTIAVRTINIFGQHSDEIEFNVANPYPTGPWPLTGFGGGTPEAILGFRAGSAAQVYWFSLDVEALRDSANFPILHYVEWGKSNAPDIQSYYVFNRAGLRGDALTEDSVILNYSDVEAVITQTRYDLPVSALADGGDAWVLDHIVIEADSMGLTFPFELIGQGITIGYPDTGG